MFSLENNVPTPEISEFIPHVVVSLMINFIVQQFFHATFGILFCVREQRNNKHPK